MTFSLSKPDSLSLDCLISGVVVGLIVWSVEVVVVVGFFCVSVEVGRSLVLCLFLFHKKIYGFGFEFLGLGGKKISRFGWKFMGLIDGGGGWVCVYVCLLNMSYFSVWFERKSWFTRENVNGCSRKIYEVGWVCCYCEPNRPGLYVYVCFIRNFLVLGGKKMLWWKS